MSTVAKGAKPGTWSVKSKLNDKNGDPPPNSNNSQGSYSSETKSTQGNSGNKSNPSMGGKQDQLLQTNHNNRETMEAPKIDRPPELSNETRGAPGYPPKSKPSQPYAGSQSQESSNNYNNNFGNKPNPSIGGRQEQAGQNNQNDGDTIEAPKLDTPPELSNETRGAQGYPPKNKPSQPYAGSQSQESSNNYNSNFGNSIGGNSGNSGKNLSNGNTSGLNKGGVQKSGGGSEPTNSMAGAGQATQLDPNNAGSTNLSGLGKNSQSPFVFKPGNSGNNVKSNKPVGNQTAGSNRDAETPNQKVENESGIPTQVHRDPYAPKS